MAAGHGGQVLLSQATSDLIRDVLPEDVTLASASDDYTILLWDVDPESWKARTCRMANRNMTLAEWQEYMGANTPYPLNDLTCPNLPPGDGVTLTPTP